VLVAAQLCACLDVPAHPETNLLTLHACVCVFVSVVHPRACVHVCARALQVMDLLKQPERHAELLPLLEEALCLLAAPLAHCSSSSNSGSSSSSSNFSSGSGSDGCSQQQERQELTQRMQAVWRGLLAALSRALASCAAVAAAERAAAAAGAGSGGGDGGAPAADEQLSLAAAAAAAVPAAAAAAAALAAGAGVADGGLCVWDLPTLNLLMLGLRWVFVLRLCPRGPPPPPPPPPTPPPNWRGGPP
jgi:hypothetical protein